LCKIDESDKWPKSLLLYKDVIKLVLGLKTNRQGGVIKYASPYNTVHTVQLTEET